MSKTSRIEISFPVGVEVSDAAFHQVVEAVSNICKAYEEANPGRVMWPCGIGSKVTYIPMTREEEQERGIEFDNDVLEISCSERERYHRWFTPKLESLKDAECCRDCGVVKNERNESGACRGKVKVEMRS